MAAALRFAPLLLVAVAVAAAVGPAGAEPLRPSVNLQSIEAVRPHEPRSPRIDPALRLRLFQEDEETLPAWTLPFGRGADERDRGLSFSVRPGRLGLKAKAKIRF